MPTTATLFQMPPTGVREDNLSIEVDAISQAQWSGITAGFGDASLYQTWPYEAVRSGECNVSHLLLKRNSTYLAAVQVRIVKFPYLPVGVAYIFWGPLWRRRDAPADLEVFRLAVRALRDEY